MKDIDTIKMLVEEAKKFPDRTEPTIEYKGELPEVEGITPTSFFGVRARFNKNSNGKFNLIYKLQ